MSVDTTTHYSIGIECFMIYDNMVKKKDVLEKKMVKVKVKDLKGYERNNKKHWENVKHIKASIERNWYISPIIVDENLQILAWHGRRLALDWLNKEIEVLQVTWLTEEQKKDFRLSDNKLSELSEWDLENVNIELSYLNIPILTELFIKEDEDIDFDNIEANNERGGWDKKVQNVACPMCDHNFSI